MLTWLDIFVLRVIIVATDDSGTPPKQKELYDIGGGLINKSLNEQGIDRILAKRLSGNNQLDTIIATLRELGFIDLHGGYAPTEKGRLFLKGIHPNYWLWPLTVPIKNGTLLMDKATYLPKF